jgi:hypothetical protein
VEKFTYSFWYDVICYIEMLQYFATSQTKLEHFAKREKSPIAGNKVEQKNSNWS